MRLAREDIVKAHWRSFCGCERSLIAEVVPEYKLGTEHTIFELSHTLTQQVSGGEINSLCFVQVYMFEMISVK